MEDLGLASLVQRPTDFHVIKFEACTEIRVNRLEEDGIGQLKRTVHTYYNEPGIIDVYTDSLEAIQARGPEHIHQVATYIMDLLWGKVAPSAGTPESATILGVKRQRVHQQLMQAGKMPIPIARLAATSLWRTVDVIEFGLARPRR